MREKKRGAADFVPDDRSLASLRAAVQHCRGCDLYKHATQAVFGDIDDGQEGHPKRVAVMMVGEQPGDREDLEGRPFVGPAGKLLDSCLEEAGIDRSEVYVTNAVKHFKWEPRGKIRLHKKPSITEVHACRPWLDAEIDTIKPQLIVCLGAVAAQSLLGSAFKVTANRGVIQEIQGLPPIMATVHPASILRARTEEDRRAQKRSFIDDLKRTATLLHSL